MTIAAQVLIDEELRVKTTVVGAVSQQLPPQLRCIGDGFGDLLEGSRSGGMAAGRLSPQVFRRKDASGPGPGDRHQFRASTSQTRPETLSHAN